MTLRFREEVDGELTEAMMYYERQRPGLGLALYDEFRRALQDMIEHPLSNQTFAADARRKRLHRFPYGILYAVENNELVILAFGHLHRRPSYWRDRIV